MEGKRLIETLIFSLFVLSIVVLFFVEADAKISGRIEPLLIFLIVFLMAVVLFLERLFIIPLNVLMEKYPYLGKNKSIPLEFRQLIERYEKLEGMVRRLESMQRLRRKIQEVFDISENIEDALYLSMEHIVKSTDITGIAIFYKNKSYRYGEFSDELLERLIFMDRFTVMKYENKNIFHVWNEEIEMFYLSNAEENGIDELLPIISLGLKGMPSTGKKESDSIKLELLSTIGEKEKEIILLKDIIDCIFAGYDNRVKFQERLNPSVYREGNKIYVAVQDLRYEVIKDIMYILENTACFQKVAYDPIKRMIQFSYTGGRNEEFRE